jgi:hypothetical protein
LAVTAKLIQVEPALIDVWQLKDEINKLSLPPRLSQKKLYLRTLPGIWQDSYLGYFCLHRGGTKMGFGDQYVDNHTARYHFR